MKYIAVFFMVILNFGSSCFAAESSVDFDKLFEDNGSHLSEQVIERKRTSRADAQKAKGGTDSIETPRTWIGAAAHAVYTCDDCPPPSSASTPAFIPCNSGDRCFRILKQVNSYRYKIECTKGYHIGSKYEICGKDYGRKWASGCGFGDAFAFHYRSAEQAGKKACDW